MSENKTDAVIPQEKISSLYDSKAWIYNAWAFLTESKACNKALKLAGIQDGQHYFEVAVGTGILFNKVVKLNPNGTNIGIDISEAMLSKAKERLGFDCPKFEPTECEDRAIELLSLYRAFAKKYTDQMLPKN